MKNRIKLISLFIIVISSACNSNHIQYEDCEIEWFEGPNSKKDHVDRVTITEENLVIVEKGSEIDISKITDNTTIRIIKNN